MLKKLNEALYFSTVVKYLLREATIYKYKILLLKFANHKFHKTLED